MCLQARIRRHGRRNSYHVGLFLRWCLAVSHLIESSNGGVFGSLFGMPQELGAPQPDS